MKVCLDQELVFISAPKCGSHTGFAIMEDIGSESCGAQHGVIVPQKYIDYTIFTFTRNPYNRVASLYNWLTKPGSDILRAINYELFKDEIKDFKFKTFCKWLGTLTKDNYFYEMNTCQHEHLKQSNVINKIKYIKIEDNPLIELNKFTDVFNMPHVLKTVHASFGELADNECIDIINKWAEKDFNYGYNRL